ncbi:MAG: hypothetical protein Q8P92_05610 [Candidatus Daviesbacteria bacterium]|nr:hypothetical protein [Candidatus Daviesbacteria bacterium]
MERREFLQYSALATAAWLISLNGPDKHKPPENRNPLELKNYLDFYRRSAVKNIVTFTDGTQAIIPSSAYGDEIYMRDSFFTCVGLENLLVNDCLNPFEERQLQNGQLAHAIPRSLERNGSDPRDDESTLIYLIGKGVANRQFQRVSREAITKAWSFIQSHVFEGWYLSDEGPFRYWADTYINKSEDVISYNQGLYALALRFLNKFDPKLVPNHILSQAEENFRSLFRNDLGFIPLSKNTSYQDISALLPEFLARYYFHEGILQNNHIISSLNHLIRTASVWDNQQRLKGIKTICQPDGSFLPPDYFFNHLNNPGEYHNGGYWPLYVLVALCLAYKITLDEKYKSIATVLVQEELSDGRSQEFIYLAEGREGTHDAERSDYSWNALLIPAFKWSGMVSI